MFLLYICKGILWLIWRNSEYGFISYRPWCDAWLHVSVPYWKQVNLLLKYWSMPYFLSFLKLDVLWSKSSRSLLTLMSVAMAMDGIGCWMLVSVTLELTNCFLYLYQHLNTSSLSSWLLTHSDIQFLDIGMNYRLLVYVPNPRNRENNLFLSCLDLFRRSAIFLNCVPLI